jgi:hypothetical protein
MTAQLSETSAVLEAKKTYDLPPLILHPFADAAGPDKLVESSRASLILQGLLPAGETTREDLDRTLLDGRFSELRMLFYVGKDIMRWIDQCLEHVERTDGALPEGVRFQSFAALLIQDPPKAVEEKLRRWGVADYKSIFSRALGLNTLFGPAPERPALSDEFIRNYFRYADQLFSCQQTMSPFAQLRSEQFHFDLYSSAEYAKLLEREWA